VRRANVLIVILLAASLLVACGKEDRPAEGATTTATTPTAKAEAAARASAEGCKPVAAPKPRPNADRRRSRRRLSRRRTYVAVVTTNCGTIRIRLAVRRAPRTTASFAGLARNHFFDDLTFHRIAKPGGNDFVIQAGDPLGSGNGGPGYSVVEAPPRNTRYLRYDVAMAKATTEQPGTSGSQFFVVTAADARLDPDYALLGKVIGGRRVVRRIAAVPTDPVSEMPIAPVVISRVRITSR
jgi:cyclophilin family peptidyl-prolyl cis-trans isomerase